MCLQVRVGGAGEDKACEVVNNHMIKGFVFKAKDFEFLCGPSALTLLKVYIFCPY